jgi:hypothetical protein
MRADRNRPKPMDRKILKSPLCPRRDGPHWLPRFVRRWIRRERPLTARQWEILEEAAWCCSGRIYHPDSRDSPLELNDLIDRGLMYHANCRWSGMGPCEYRITKDGEKMVPDPPLR